MPRQLKYSKHLSASRREALLAIRLYNDPHEPRSFEGFIVHMHLAWLYLLHAEFKKSNRDYRYRDRRNPRRFERVDGEYKHWELAKCVRERWTNANHPVRKNIEFFMLLRNKIEHRHSDLDSNLALSISGKAQALIVNYETELTEVFGADQSMATLMRFPIFVGAFSHEGQKALEDLQDRLPNHLKQFLSEFHTGLSEEVENDPKFDFRLRVVLEKVNRGPKALAIQFSNWDDLTDDEKVVMANLGRRGQVITRDRNHPVAADGLLRPSEVVEKVSAAIPFVFNQHHATQVWKKYRVRPLGDDPHPENTLAQYCVYDSLAKSWGYTTAWVDHIVASCQTFEGFEGFTGCPAKLKPQTLPFSIDDARESL